MGKAIIDQLTLGILPGHDQSGQVVEQHRKVDLVLQQGLLLDLVPNGWQVFGQRIQGSSQAVIVERVLGNAQVLGNQGRCQQIHDAIKRTRRHQPVQD